MVKSIEMDIGKKLAGQIADGQTDLDAVRVEERCPINPPGGFAVALENVANEPEHGRVGHHPPDTPRQHLVVEAREYLRMSHLRATGNLAANSAARRIPA